VVEDEGGQWQGCSGRERHRSTRRGWGDGTFKDRLIASWRRAGCQRGRFGRQTRQRGQREQRTRPDRPIQPSATPPKHTDTRREREEEEVLGGAGKIERVLGAGCGRGRRIYFLAGGAEGDRRPRTDRRTGGRLGWIIMFAEIEGEAHNSLDQCGMRYACLQQNTDKAQALLPHPNYLIRPNSKFLQVDCSVLPKSLSTMCRAESAATPICALR
jgi:hypothetical protein